MRNIERISKAFLAFTFIALAVIIYKQHTEISLLQSTKVLSATNVKVSNNASTLTKEVGFESSEQPHSIAITNQISTPQYGFAATVNTLEFKEALLLVSETILDGRYVPLFNILNIDRDKLSKLKELLAKRMLWSSGQNDTEMEIMTLLGPVGYEKYKQFENNLPTRNIIAETQNLLVACGAGMNAQQQELLNRTLASSGSIGQIEVTLGFEFQPDQLRKLSLAIEDQAAQRMLAVQTDKLLGDMSQHMHDPVRSKAGVVGN